MDAQRITRQMDLMRKDRQRGEALTRDCFLHSFPERADGWGGDITDADSLKGKQADLLDPTATESGRTLAATIQGGTIPANSLWFGFDAEGDDAEAAQFLQNAERTVFANIHARNFDSEAYECLLDIVGGGALALFVDEHPEGGYRFQQWPLSQVFYSCSKPGGNPDIVFREYELSAAQAVQEFGGSKGGNKGVSDAITKAAEDEPTKLFKFIHAIQPRKIYVHGGVTSRNLPIESCHVEVGKNRICRESGYHEMPVIIARWRRIPRSEYPVGPMADALPAVKRLNKLMSMEMTSADIAICGMWIGVDDGVLNPRTVKVGPRVMIVANDTDSIKPLQTGANFQLSEHIATRLQQQIKTMLMADQMPPADGPVRSATEFHIRAQMLRQILGPMYGRMMSEFLRPLLERCFGIALRAGVLGPIPQSLQGKEVSIQFSSPLARAQLLEEVNAIDTFVQGTLVAAQEYPEALDSINIDEAQAVRAKALRVPPKVARTMEELAEYRNMKNDAAKAAQGQDMLQQLAMGAAGKAIETMGAQAA